MLRIPSRSEFLAASKSFRPTVSQFIQTDKLVEIVVLVLSLRVGLGLFGTLSLILMKPTSVGGNWLELLYSDNAPTFWIVGPWQRWDALWYQKIALDGYTSGDGSTAFFPMFPALMRLGSLVTGGDLVLGGLLITTLALIGALVVMWNLLSQDFGSDIADASMQYLVLFPTAFFFLAPFTEGVFLLFTVISMFGARRGYWWLAGTSGALAGLTRAQGALLVIPLVFEYVRQNRHLSVRWLQGLLATGLPALGTIGFMAFSFLLVGGTKPGEALQQWGYQIVMPWNAVAASWSYVITKGSVTEAFNLAVIILFTLGIILAIRRMPLSYSLLMIPNVLLLFTRQMQFSPFMSVGRYVLVLFPGFVVLALYTKNQHVRQALTLISVLLLALFFYYFVHWGFVA